MKNYKLLIENIRTRSNPENIELNSDFTNELATIKYSDILRYVKHAMKAVEPEYTQRSKRAGEKVKNHLEECLTEVKYRYQGSVMTNTHIMGASDIDLLVIANRFYSFDRSGIQNALSNGMNYNFFEKGLLQKELEGAGYFSALEDLRKNRMESERKLKSIYSVCDISHPKAIKITNKSINRDVDIVIANWYDNVLAVLKQKDSEHRGIQVYNKDTHSKGNPDYPFLSIARINRRSRATIGRLKKMIRFVKNVKTDSNIEIKLSSFDINAICYDINTDNYLLSAYYELVPIIYNQFAELLNSEEKANRLKSVDGNEYIFRDKPEKLASVRSLLAELDSILVDLKEEVAV